MRRPVVSSDGSVVGSRAFVDEEFIASFPTLYAWLCDVKWDDGVARQPGTMLLCVDAGVLKVWLNDKALSRSAWLSGDSLAGLLAAVESGLRDETLAWRPVKAGGRR